MLSQKRTPDAFKTSPLSSCCPGIVQRISNGNKKTSYWINIGFKIPWRQNDSKTFFRPAIESKMPDMNHFWIGTSCGFFSDSFIRKRTKMIVRKRNYKLNLKDFYLKRWYCLYMLMIAHRFSNPRIAGLSPAERAINIMSLYYNFIC